MAVTTAFLLVAALIPGHPPAPPPLPVLPSEGGGVVWSQPVPTSLVPLGAILTFGAAFYCAFRILRKPPSQTVSILKP